jgi:hypothetical protein
MACHPLRRIALAAAAAAVAVSAHAGQIQLAWDAVPGATGYRIYYGTQSGTYTSNLTSSATTTTISGLQDCTTYYLAVKAYNAAGESPTFSNELSGWPRPEITSATPGVAIQGSQVTVTVNGTNFQSGALVEIDNPRLTLTGVRTVSCTQMQFVATLDPPAPNVRAAQVGRWTVSVANPDDVFGQRSQAFEVAINPARFNINTSDAATQNRLDGKDTIWIARLFGSQDGGATYDPDSDFDGDGWVDGNDLAYLASNLGRCWSGSNWTAASCPANLR